MFMKQYKVNQFSKCMGVTKDVVKHYQEMGIIEPDVNEKNRYRFYNVMHGERILASRRFRNMGFNLPETNEIMSQKNGEDLIDMLGEREVALEKELMLLQQKKERVSEIKQQCQEAIACRGQWKVKTLSSFYYLPHIVGVEFIYTDLLQEEYNTWMKDSVFTSKVLLVDHQSFSGIMDRRFMWGLFMEEHYFDVLQMEQTENTKYYESMQCAVFYYYEEYTNDRKNMIMKVYEDAVKQGLNVRDDFVVVKHVFDEYVDEKRYENYMVYFLLES